MRDNSRLTENLLVWKNRKVPGFRETKLASNRVRCSTLGNSITGTHSEAVPLRPHWNLRVLVRQVRNIFSSRAQLTQPNLKYTNYDLLMCKSCPVLQDSLVLHTNRKIYKFRFLKVKTVYTELWRSVHEVGIQTSKIMRHSRLNKHNKTKWELPWPNKISHHVPKMF